MHILRSRRALDAWRATRDDRGETVGFVPTMGYLHEGHLSLIDEAARRADTVLVSIYVNPTQFGEGEDLDTYPRDEEGDLAACRARGASAVFLPSTEDIYPSGFQTVVSVGALGGYLCGAARPGHFDGVCTVVARLFGLLRPHIAVFGRKDFQQLAIIRRMVEDLLLPVEVVGAPIVREPDGLAMSSRNAYLDPALRDQALGLSRALAAAEAAIEAGSSELAAVRAAAEAQLQGPATRLDYLEIVDPATLQPVEELEGPVLMAIAAFVGRPRLIDNRLLAPSGEAS